MICFDRQMETTLHLAAIESFSDVAGLLHRDNNELLGVCDQVGYLIAISLCFAIPYDIVKSSFSAQSTF